MQTKIRIASRNSQLAMAQTYQIIDLLLQANKQLTQHDIQIIQILSGGDQNLKDPLYQMQSIGVFTKQVEKELLEGRADIAVHSLKDLPTVSDPRLHVTAIPQLQKRADVVILHQKYKGIDDLKQLPSKCVVGSSSLRRIQCLKHYYPHLEFKNIRGNLQTRLKKLRDGEYDCIILAEAGLNRLAMNNEIDIKLDENIFGYAPGQGALAVQTIKNNDQIHQIVKNIDHQISRYIVEQERLLLNRLEGGCKLPIAVISQYEDSVYRLTAQVWDNELGITVRRTLETYDRQADLGELLAQDMKQNGAEEILKKVRNH